MIVVNQMNDDNKNLLQSRPNIINTQDESVKTRPRCTIKSNNHGDNISEEVDVHIDWGGSSKTPLSSYPHDVLWKVAYRLFVGLPTMGGKVLPDSIIHGYTEIKRDGHIFRLHPSYSNNAC